MKKMKSVVIVLLVGVLFLCPIYASADAGEKITEMVYPEVYLDDIDENLMPRTVGTAIVSFDQESATVGSGRASIYTTSTASYIKITVTLQQAASGSNSYTNSSQDPVTKTVYNTNHIYKAYSFKVNNTKNFRVKIVVKDKADGIISTRTIYKKMT